MRGNSASRNSGWCGRPCTIGWSGPYRIHGSVLHFDIRGDKVWIQSDGTEEGIANRLGEAGIPKDRIVLAVKPPEIRPHTGFAVA